MIKALNTAATGMAAQQTNIDVIANNIANVNTTGYHRSRAEFQDLLYQTVRVPGGATGDGQNLPTGIQIGHGTRTVSTENIHIQGNLKQTGGSFDIAIEGSGFFQVTRPNGEIGYTRAGNLKTNAEGQMVTVDGYLLEPSISIPTDATSVTISPDGTVSVVQPNSSTSQQVGRITLAGFANPAGLQAIGRVMFVPTDASGQPLVANPGEEGLGTLSQGFLESSNVEVVNEMIDLITSQRAYEINQRVVTAADQMLQRTSER
jgi:flagellar basal-body rod protein FlgG